MKLENHEPQNAISYLAMLTHVVKHYREFGSHGDIVSLLGGLDNLTDVTDVPEIRLMEQMTPLPSGFSQRVYCFKESADRRGLVDAAFHTDQLVNVRAQLFFGGWLGPTRAQRYLRSELKPFLHNMFGTEPGVYVDSEPSSYGHGGLVIVCRYVPSSPSISTHITDERYL